MNDLAIQPRDQLPAVQSEAVTMIDAVLRAASDPTVDVAKMERLMVMAQDMRKQQAETDFNQAMGDVQAQMQRIGTDKRNSQTNSNYATYAKLDRALRPLYTQAGFALSFGSEEAPYPEMVRVICHVTHRGGHTRKYLIDMPADGKGAKGNDVMTKTHATGSATQYGMRYLLKMIFNVAIGEDPDDDDGNLASEVDPVALEWIDVAGKLTTPMKYDKYRKDLVAAYGGDPTKIPPRVLEAFNAARDRVMPKD
jgi:hypothetical protein